MPNKPTKYGSEADAYRAIKTRARRRHLLNTILAKGETTLMSQYIQEDIEWLSNHPKIAEAGTLETSERLSGTGRAVASVKLVERRKVSDDTK